MVLSLQGCMAAGKTSAASYLQRHMPGVAVYYETNAPLIRQIREQGLDSERYEDFLEIQRRWIAYQAERYRQAARRPRAIIDFGPEETEFHTLFYPQTIGRRWQIEAPPGPGAGPAPPLYAGPDSLFRSLGTNPAPPQTAGPLPAAGVF